MTKKFIKMHKAYKSMTCLYKILFFVSPVFLMYEEQPPRYAKMREVTSENLKTDTIYEILVNNFDNINSKDKYLSNAARETMKFVSLYLKVKFIETYTSKAELQYEHNDNNVASSLKYKMQGNFFFCFQEFFIVTRLQGKYKLLEEFFYLNVRVESLLLDYLEKYELCNACSFKKKMMLKTSIYDFVKKYEKDLNSLEENEKLLFENLENDLHKIIFYEKVTKDNLNMEIEDVFSFLLKFNEVFPKDSVSQKTFLNLLSQYREREFKEALFFISLSNSKTNVPALISNRQLSFK